MTLNELRELKKKSDRLVETFQNDRVLMQNTLDKIRLENSKNLDEFLDSLKEYAKLIPDNDSYDRIPTFMLFRKFTKHRHSCFWEEDTWLCIYAKGIHFLCSNGDEEYCIDITEEESSCYFPSGHHTYSKLYFDDFKKFILEHKEELKSLVETAVENAINHYVIKNKAKNDSLYERAEELNGALLQ